MLILFDINEEFINEAKRLEKYGIHVLKANIKTLINEISINSVISPANCFGFMDGGIDNVYRELFPNIQKKVQDKISEIQINTKLGRKYLPIGSAITVKTGNEKCKTLICAPTMFFPSNIENTNNIFYTFLAILYLHRKNKNRMIACPGLGTGVGMVSPEYAVNQIEKAIIEYNKTMTSDEYKKLIKYIDNKNIILRKIPCKQPNNYANYEIPLH